MIVPAALLAAHSDELINPEDPAWGDELPDELPQAAAMTATATSTQTFTALPLEPQLHFTTASSCSECPPGVEVYYFASVDELCQASSRRWTRTTSTNKPIPRMARTTTDA